MTQVLSWSQVARNGSECDPKWAGLWRNLVGAWVPAVGPTGYKLFDLSRRGGDGDLSGMDALADWVICPYGYALDFDGGNDYISNNFHPSSVLGTRFTIAALVYGQSGASFRGICGAHAEGAANGITFGQFVDGTAYFNYGYGDGWGNTATYSMPLNSWRFIIATYEAHNGGYIRVYDWGSQVATSAIETQSISHISNFYIGRASFSGADRYWDGQIAAVMVWNTILDPTTIRQMSLNPLGMFATDNLQIINAGLANRITLFGGTWGMII